MIKPVQKAIYAVIGNPVAHSLSPVMMNAVFEALRLPAVYLALQVDELEEDLTTLARMGVRGLSVTIPHKEIAYRLAEVSDEAARTMGAVNTLRLSGSHWEGINTDWLGAIAALRQAGAARQPSAPSTQHSFRGHSALVIGAGGVARAVGFALKREGAALTLTNRSEERGEALARALNCDFLSLADLNRPKIAAAFDILVQCTSVGLAGEAEYALIPHRVFRSGAMAMDTVYRPLWTPFLRKAQAAGCLAVPGLEMLLHQGIAQLEWWFGEGIRSEVVLPLMRAALMEVLADEKDH